MSEEVNHILHGKKFDSGHGAIACRVAWVREITDESGQLWLYYTVGADLGPKIDYYTGRRLALADPETVSGLYQIGLPVHRRKVVPTDKGASPDQALADADGENDYPRFMAGASVCYTRADDGVEWLVYQRGPHMRQALEELWRLGKCVSRLEEPCLDHCGAPLTYHGKKVFRRRLFKPDHPMAKKPDEFANG